MTDAELSLALARLRGFNDAYIHPKGWVAYLYDDGYATFNPIRCGADFDAVLQWVRRIPELWHPAWSAAYDNNSVYSTTDAEFRRAVCEAIVGAAG